MYLSSTINPLSKSLSNVPVGVFRYGSGRKFLRVFDDYEEMLRTIKRAFNIERNSCVSLHTASLDVCQGERVEIDESAYPFLTMLLDDVEVVQEKIDAVRQGQGEVLEATVVLDHRRSSSHKRLSTISPFEDLRDVLDDTSSPKATSSQPPPNSSSTEEEYAYPPIRAYARDRGVYDSRIDDEFEADVRMAEEFEEEQVLQAITSVEERPNEDHMPKAKFKPMSRVTSASSTPQVKKEKEVATPVLASRGKAPENAPKSIRKETNVTQDTDTRFEISITGPQPHQTAQFKTRGKHSVSKVLGAACKTFEIDSRRAKLFYVMQFPNEQTGDPEPVEVECDPDETMSQAGVTGETQLFIRVEQIPFDDDLLNFD